MRIILIVLSCVALVGPAWAGKYALVLGNAEYETLSDLKNTHSDAEAYHETFQGLGYQVTFLKDLDFETTLEALDTFYAQLQPGDDVVLVFSGHGWSDGQVNYLIPTDAPRQARDSLLKRKTIALKNGYNGILDEFAQLGVGLTLAIIDACRNNPFEPPQGRKSVAMGRGLAPVQAQSGTLVIFSAGAGQEALDRLPDDPKDQRLSVFTRTFLPHLQSGLYVERAMAEAQKETADLARQAGGHMQTPAIYDEALGDTCLSGECVYQVTPAAQVRMPTTAAAPSQCDLLYNEARVSRECFQFEGYLDVCADHTFAPIARRFVSRQCTADTAAVQVTPRPQAQAVTPVAPQVAETVEKAPLEQTAQDQLTEYFALQDKIAVKERSLQLARDASMWHRVRDLTADLRKLRVEQSSFETDVLRDVLAQVKAVQAELASAKRSLALARKFSTPSRVGQLERQTAQLQRDLDALRTGTAAVTKKAAVVVPAPVRRDSKADPDQDLRVQDCDGVALHEAHPDVLAGRVTTQPVDFEQISGSEAVRLCRRAVEAFPDHARSLSNLARAHWRVGDTEDAVVQFRKADDLGDLYAMRSLSLIFKNGDGVPQNLPLALSYLRRAAAAGYPIAQNDLGKLYESGTGVQTDLAKAASYYRAAAEQGDSFGQTNLAVLLRDGKGVPMDLPAARRLFRLSAEQGHRSAQVFYGNALYNGEGGTTNQVEALRWYRRAANNGSRGAMYNLGLAYRDGKGTKKNLKVSADWFQQAADLEDPMAYEQLGHFYEYGRGVQADPIVAAQNYFAALKKGRDWVITRDQGSWDKETAKALQRLLKDEGFYKGPIDGIMGSGAVGAMKAALKSE
ncbi:MAG: caspase family protein [Rhodobacteraceae bacterium]|nr:caspase family protein [Paracoccaceae bacterium]